MLVEDWVDSSIRAFFCVTGITGNFWLGLRSLPKSKSQMRPNDLLFINLAVSNLITNCLVDLPDTLAQFVNNWFMGRNYCGVLQFSSDLSETSSIFSTMFISMYWHQKLVGSVRRGGAPVQMDNLRLVTVFLAGSWSVALMFSVPHFFIAEHNGNESLEVCEERFPTLADKRTYDALYLLLANVAPLVGITYASVQIVLVLMQSQKRVMDHSNHNSGTQATATKSKAVSHSQTRAAKSVVAVASIFIICWFSHLVLRIYSSFRNSILAVKLTNFIGASYTCFVPYVYLHGVKKLDCSCCW
ncbi:trace amine-associated receptor 4 [Rhinichthys klamathensis goyatoka]|uniref:trace amine-associated receptor 4 n=1 Tax=Rhinichthys klamathensis goyatoka TaxID=3034132 RepID=UPI0024B5A8C7|nr:trace amine-associated receptor 4 [Rhinichthys klamathensis goyatoka]